LGTALALGVLALLCFAPQASADLEFCPLGSGAGQCAPLGEHELNTLRGLAVDHETGRLYVADKNNNRIDVFAEDGEFILAFGWGVDTGAAELESCTTASGCQAGIAGSGAGQLDRPTRVAVDNDAASPGHHDVYVVDEPNSRVQRFDPTGEFVWAIGKGVDKTDNGDLCTKAETHTCGAGAESEAEGGFKERISVGIGAGGVLYLLDNLPLGTAGVMFKHRLQRFQPSGALIPPQCILFEGGLAVAFAVEADGSSWVANQGEGDAIRKYSAACAQLLEKEQGVETNELALDEAGDLFAAQREVRDKAFGDFRMITAYEPGGDYLRRFAYDKLPRARQPEGLAVHNGGEGGIFLALREAGEVIHRLTFVSAPPTLPPPGPIAVAASLEATNVSGTKATLVAEVNPEGKATQVHFEYLTQEDYEKQGNSFSGPATKSTPPEALGAEGFTLKAFEAQIGCPNPVTEAAEPGKCLIPETAYRFRVIATNADGPGEGTAEGSPPVNPFETKPLPEFGDTYATEVGTDSARLHAEVNPLGVPTSGWFEYVDDAHFQESVFAAAIKVPAVGGGQAPLDFGAGEALAGRAATIYPLQPGTTYHYRIVAEDPLIEPVAGEARVLRTFEPARVETCAENEAARIGPGALLPDCRAYEMVSPLDKAGGDIKVLEASLQTLAVLEQSADSGEKLAYGSYRSFGDAQSAPYTSQYIAQRVAGEEWRTHSINPPRGEPILKINEQIETEFRYFSTDLCESWLTTFAELPLSAGGVAGYSNLYRREDRLCGEEGYEARAPIVTPPVLKVPALLGVSGDGRHAIFTSEAKLAAEGKEGQRQLYESVDGAPPRFVCMLPGGGKVGGSCTAGSSEFGGNPGAYIGAISNDGERIFWSASGVGESKLYVRIGGTQTVAVSKAAEQAAGTSGSWFGGAAADGSRAVFTTGGGFKGEGSLYSFELAGEVTTPIAEGVLGVMGMSSDARRIYFASRKVLAAGASAGKANLYLYEAGEGGGSTSFVATLADADLETTVEKDRYSKRTARVSPDGTHAAFASLAPLTGYDNVGAVSGTASREIYRYDAARKKLICASCNPSGARPAGAARVPALATPMHGARVLSDDGRRLYFESPDRLAARDTNGRVDVYQWEEAGAGGCDAADADFAASAEGCIELVSSGQSPVDARFIEASPSGHDVFFATLSSLLPQDYGLADIYDAREGGGLPVPPPEAPPCEGDACQNPPAVAEQATPASSDYVSPKPSARHRKRRCAKGRRRVSGKGKARCVARHKGERRQGRAAR
jgi:hypothetical protein